MHAHQFLVGVACLVSEILLLSKTAKFSFLTMDYRPLEALIGWTNKRYRIVDTFRILPWPIRTL